MAARPIVVCDLNGCLVALTDRKRSDAAPEAMVGRKYLYDRPHLAAFFRAVQVDLGCDVAFWTSREPHNAEPIVRRLAGRYLERPPVFSWARDRCDPGLAGPYSSVKNLDRIADAFGPDRPFIVLDDSIEKFRPCDRGRLLLVPIFAGGPLDRGLIDHALPKIATWAAGVRKAQGDRI